MQQTWSIQVWNAHRSKKSRLSKPCKFLHNLANHFQALKRAVVCTLQLRVWCIIISFSFDLPIRTMFSFLSGVYVYVIAWALLGQDSGDSLGPTHLSDFAVSKIIGRESITLLMFEKFTRLIKCRMTLRI